MKSYHVYIMASRSKVLYVGMTSDLVRRVAEHKSRQTSGFTRDYHVTKLVFFEQHRYVLNAIAREKEIKKWGRRKKIALIESTNPDRDDLADSPLHRDIIETGRPASFLLSGVRLNIEVRRTRPSLQADNIIAVVEGSDLRDEYVIVTSHYDHNGSNPSLDGDTVYNGAADDASGVAGSLEIARVFAKAKIEGDGPRRTIMFLNTSAEERGVLGSSYFTDYDPVVPLESIRANVNLDGIGGFDAEHPAVPYVYAIESHVLGGELTKLVKGVQESHGIEIEIETSEDFNSDHRSFASHLIPYMYFSTGYTEHYHKPSDEPETIDFDHVRAIARLAFGTIWHLANDDEPVPANRAHLHSTVGFQCPPCGVTPHDDRVHDEPGYCPTCGMRLVPVRKN